MLGTGNQQGFFQADRYLLDHVGRDTFHGRLALMRECGEPFRDEEFSELYCADNGRPSVSPAMLATVLLLQAHDRVSDREAKHRADYDLRWKVALGVDLQERPFARSTLQKFRAQLVVHEKGGEILARSIEHARRRGLMKERGMQLALDTTAILGRGAVRDAYNLIGDGARLLIGALAELEGRKPADWAGAEGYSLYVGKSLKGEADIDWSDRGQARRFLARIVKDADDLLARARRALASLPEDDERAVKILSCSRLLAQILIQDVERSPAAQGPPEPPSDEEGRGRDQLALGLPDDGPEAEAPGEPDAAADASGESAVPDAGPPEVDLVRGGGRDRIISVHDPQMRHGRKSASNRFAGHKAAVAADLASGVIAAVAVMPGNAPDGYGALELVRQAEQNAALAADRVIGDCAYGDGNTRRNFHDSGYDLFARLPGRPRSDCFLKQDFRIDLEAMTCTCPAGQQTSDYRRVKTSRGKKPTRAGLFHFAREQCGPCPLRSKCIRSAKLPNRRVSVHPQEALLQRARERQNTPEGRALGRRRVVIEHRLARLCQLGIRQARFFGRTLTGFQLQMAAAVANLTLAEGDSWKVGPTDPDPEPEPVRERPDRASQLPLEDGGRDLAAAEAAAAAADTGAAGKDSVRNRPCAPGAGSGPGQNARSGPRIAARPCRIGAVAMALIAAIARGLGVNGLQGAPDRLQSLWHDFGTVADPFAARCAVWALRPGL